MSNSLPNCLKSAESVTNLKHKFKDLLFLSLREQEKLIISTTNCLAYIKFLSSG